MELRAKSGCNSYFLIVLFIVLFFPQAFSRPVVVYPNGDSSRELLGAKEVRRYIYLRTDELLAVKGVSSLPGSGDLILVANDDNPMVEGMRSLIGDTAPAGGYLIKTVNNGGRNILVIAGSDPVSTLYGAYHFAEMLGVRFFLHGDTVPDAKISLSITGFDEKGKPLKELDLRGILPFHNFPEGPDWWNRGEYKAYVSQLPKMGMNFIGFHTYPIQPGEGQPVPENGPEPTVWLGVQEDVNPDGTVKYAYPAFYAHTNHRFIFDKIDTDKFHSGSHLLFETNHFGPEVMGRNPDEADFKRVFNDVGKIWNDVFRHAQKLGVKTCLGNEAMNGQGWAEGIPPKLRKHLGLEPWSEEDNPVRDLEGIYKGVFDRIRKTHPLDYYWVWMPERWYLEASPEAVKAVEKEFLTAHSVLQEMNPGFEMATLGWQHGTSDNPDEFDDDLPASVPFGSLWGEGTDYGSNLRKLKDSRVKWAFTWMEEDWGLIQPQTEVNRVWQDLKGAIETPNCRAFLTKFWRTRAISPNIGAMSDLLWRHGPTGSKIDDQMPTDRDAYIEEYYLDWANHSFGEEVGPQVAEIFAKMDKAGEEGAATIPKPLEWELCAPGAINPNEEASWPELNPNYAFVEKMADLRPKVEGAGNLERFDYWLKSFQSLKIMGELGVRRFEYLIAMDEAEFTKALAKRQEMKRLWERLMTLETESATNSSDLGEIMNLEELNYYRLWKGKEADGWLKEGLGDKNPSGIEPNRKYSGKTRIMVTPQRTQVGSDESLELRVTVMAEGLSHPTEGKLNYRPLGDGPYKSKPLTHIGRAVYTVTLPPQSDDFEYYIEAETPSGGASFPVTAPSINQSVVVWDTGTPPERSADFTVSQKKD